MAPLRFGVLGCGDAARRLFLPGLRASREGALAAVASRDPAKAAAWGKEWGCAACGYDELLDRGDVDAVYVALPVSLHAEWAVKALEAGKHVYCEKPLAGSLEDAGRVLEAARRGGRRLMEGYMYRFHPLYEEARRIVREEIGPLRSVSARFGFQLKDGDVRRDPALQMGAFHEAGGYLVNAARGFFGAEPEAVLARFAERSGAVFAASAWLRFAEGEAFAECGYERGYRSGYDLWGERGFLSVERAFTTPPDIEPELRVSTREGARAVRLPASNHFAGAIDAFCRAVGRGDGRDRLEEEAWRQALAMEAARASARAGGWAAVER